MRCCHPVLFLCCAFTAIVASAAAPTPQEAARKAAAEVKARAEAKAAVVGKAYEVELARLGQALKENNLEEASVAAKAMIRLSAEPGRPPWQPTTRTYLSVIRQFEQKKVFGSKYSIAFYQDAINSAATARDKAELIAFYGAFLSKYALADDKQILQILETGFQDAIGSAEKDDEKAEVTLLRGLSLLRCALGDEATALGIVQSAFNFPNVTKQKQIQLCQKVAEHDPEAYLDQYAQKVLAYVKDEPTMQLGACSWVVSAYARASRHDDILPLYDKLLADPAYQGNRLKIGIDMVNYLNNKKMFPKAIAYLNQVIPTLEAQDKLSCQRLLADTYKRAAVRFYAAPDKEDLQLAINVYQDIVKQLPPEKPFDVADTRLSIAELAYKIGDFATAIAEAHKVLALPELAEKRLGTKLKAEYVLGQTAYAQEDYPKTIEILAPLYAALREKPGHYPYKRDLIEMLLRSYCAVGDFQKALGLSDDLLQSVRGYEKARYQTYIDGLKQRANSAR